MRRNKRNAYNRIRIFAFISVYLLVSVASGLGNAQESEPITKENLIAALKSCKDRRHCSRCQQCKLTAADFIQQIKQLKVSFVLSDCDEREIRKVGDFLREKGLNELIATIRNEYLAYSVTPTGSRINHSMDTVPKIFEFTLLDSYGDEIIEGKVRLIHASINSTLRLDTNYRFYEGKHSSNMFVMPRIDKSYPDGTLFIGRDLIKRSLTTDTSKSQLANDSILFLLIAHEMSHLKQMKVGCPPDGFKRMHLHADFLAGWWVARYLRTTRGDSAKYKEAYFKATGLAFDSGDAETFVSHGTPQERLGAVSAGFGLQNETDPEKVYRKGVEYVAQL